MTKVTLDTGVLPAEDLVHASQRFNCEFVVVTVTTRELAGTPYEVHLVPYSAIPETAVWSESRWDHATSVALRTRIPACCCQIKKRDATLSEKQRKNRLRTLIVDSPSIENERSFCAIRPPSLRLPSPDRELPYQSHLPQDDVELVAVTDSMRHQPACIQSFKHETISST